MGCCVSKKADREPVLENKQAPIKKFSYQDVKNNKIYKKNVFIPIAEDREF